MCCGILFVLHVGINSSICCLMVIEFSLFFVVGSKKRMCLRVCLSHQVSCSLIINFCFVMPTWYHVVIKNVKC